MEDIGQLFLDSAIQRVKYYKDLGGKTFVQLKDDDFYYQPNDASNSIAVIIQHMSGNMRSRWTNFLTEDGEKEWRNRDAEFETIAFKTEELLNVWEDGWDCFLNALSSLASADLLKTIYIRKEALLVVDAINRQLAHYPYHVGQIVYIGRMIRDRDWQNLSIAPGGSTAFNESDRLKDPAKKF